MKNLKINQKRYKGFTLIELLVVVVIIAVLMGMLIPAVMRAQVRARIATARADMSNIKGAILSYQTDYSRFPVPRPKWSRTYPPSPHLPAPSFGLPTPSLWEKDANGFYDPPLPTWALNPVGGDITFGVAGTPNYGVMRILCSVDDSFSRNPVPANSLTQKWPISDEVSSLTVNGNDSRNPKKNKYLDVPSGDDLRDPGLDPVYNFNDPFGQQYIITMDMDGDGDCSDRYYRKADMNANVVIGLRSSTWTPPGGAVEPEHVLMGSVMIYSRGPDQRASATVSALQGVNADNILDWK